ncbi:MAG TPA: glutaredoxin family protein [Symbiobacteriaceae bacterium]|nr:glutaredoxin family protein [Symbiobacteriaceae bacterium]
MAEITVYTSVGCPYCVQLKRWLDERNLAYTEKNVSENQAYFDELHARGIFTSPVVLIDDTPVVGYRPNKMKEILGV